IELAGLAGTHRLDRGDGALQGLLVERRGMGEARRLAGDRAQAEALGGVVRGAFELAVVERQALALLVFEEQLAVVAARQRLVDHLGGAALVEAALAEKQAVGSGEMVDRLAHGMPLKCPRQTTRTILPKWALAFMCASASAAWASGNVLSIGRLRLPASAGAHQAFRAPRAVGRTF